MHTIIAIYTHLITIIDGLHAAIMIFGDITCCNIKVGADVSRMFTRWVHVVVKFRGSAELASEPKHQQHPQSSISFGQELGFNEQCDGE